MSCGNHSCASVADWPLRHSQLLARRSRPVGRSDQPFVLWLIVALYESFHEALEMQRDAYRQHRLPEE
jgi:hypothetical protein